MGATCHVLNIICQNRRGKIATQNGRDCVEPALIIIDFGMNILKHSIRIRELSIFRTHQIVWCFFTPEDFSSMCQADRLLIGTQFGKVNAN